MRSLALTILLSLLTAPAFAGGGDPVPEPTRDGKPEVSAASTYNQGLALADAGDFLGSEAKYRRAIGLDPQMPEAWNGLGHSLKQQKRFPEALAAYDQALALRPDFPLAMQYLGELYVEMGRMDEARALLGKLRQVDEENANKLANAIYLGSAKW